MTTRPEAASPTHRGVPAREPALVETLPPPRSRWIDLLGEGLAAGALGGSIVAAFFLVLDALQGRPLWTPSLLGSALFLGQSVDQVTAVDLRMVLAYTGVHLSVFVFTGVLAAWTVSLLETHMPAAILLVLLFVSFEVAFFAFALGWAPQILGALGSAQVALANLFAAGSMAFYFVRRHPGAIRRIERLFEP